MSKLLVLICVASVVPGFFILTWLVSGYHRLVRLRERLKQAALALQETQAGRSSAHLGDPSSADNLAPTSHAYNEAVNAYNAACKTFPTSIIARTLHFTQAEPDPLDSVAGRQVSKRIDRTGLRL
jgi:hypothetical protein